MSYEISQLHALPPERRTCGAPPGRRRRHWPAAGAGPGSRAGEAGAGACEMQVKEPEQEQEKKGQEHEQLSSMAYLVIFQLKKKRLHA